MARQAVDKLTLERWGTMPAAEAISLLARHIKQNHTFKPIKAAAGTRWHVTTQRAVFETLCTEPKFWEEPVNSSGSGASDLARQLRDPDLKRPVALPNETGT